MLLAKGGRQIAPALSLHIADTLNRGGDACLIQNCFGLAFANRAGANDWRVGLSDVIFNHHADSKYAKPHFFIS